MSGVQDDHLTKTPGCWSCRFKQFILGQGQPTLECRRWPPSVFPISGARGIGFVTQFPIVKPDLKCGEYVPVTTLQS